MGVHLKSELMKRARSIFTKFTQTRASSQKKAATPSSSSLNLSLDPNTDNLLKYLIQLGQMNQKNLRISIEGNISSGKSSIINYLKRRIDPAIELSHVANNGSKVLFDETNCDIMTCKLNDKSLNTSNKSTLDFLKQSNVMLKIIPEPVHLWSNLNGNNLLSLMYSDPEKWAFPFQSYVQLTMLQNHLELLNIPTTNDVNNENSENVNKNRANAETFFINIMERSLFSARYCFVENLYNSELLNKVHYEILDKWFNWMTSSHDCNLDIIFYLRTNPEVCMKRLTQRDRPGEASKVSLEYLQNIHDLHEKWLNPASSYTTSTNGIYYKPSTVIVIDADQPLDDVYKIIEHETKNVVTLAN